jgi:hypothetical protein
MSLYPPKQYSFDQYCFGSIPMALHRDIYWIGRQWSVTGYGLQLIDQRLKGVFDIEIARLRDERVLDAMRAHDWLKAEDFDKAIAAAHKRFPEPARLCPDEQSKPASPIEMLLKLSEPVSPAPANSPAPVNLPPPAPVVRTESELAKPAPQSKPALPVETPLRLSESVSPTVPHSPAPARLPPPALGLRAESELAKAELHNKAALALETLLRLSESVAPAPPNSHDPAQLPPPALALRAESEVARSGLLDKPAMFVETPSGAGEPVAPTPAKLPLSSLELRRESERARADLQSKMSALDGLLRSRGFVAAQPVVPQPSILAVQAEGELAKFAPQWRVRN